jgi:hypothetical protein
VDPLIVVDESLDLRLAEEISGRGREATSHEEVGTTGLEDEPMLRKLAADLGGRHWVLVTADDAMPAEHAEVIEELQVTIATIHGDYKRVCDAHDLTMTQEQFRRDSVHRWLHIIAAQERGEIRRYTPVGHAPWRARIRHEKKAERAAARAKA